MKKLFQLFTVTLSVITLSTSCHDNDEPETRKQTIFCEIGNTGKVVSTFNVATGKDGAPNTIVSNMTLMYSPDCSEITAYNLSEGIPGLLMKDYTFTLNGGTVVDNNGEVVFNDFKFNDKGFVSHLVGLQGFSTADGATHVTYDIIYNKEDRMSKITYTYLDANEKTTRIQNIDLSWENGLLKSVKFDNNGEVSTTTYEYGNQANVHRQPSASFFCSLNLLSVDIMRPFLAAGYFGKGPDKFEVSSHEAGSAVAEDRTYSVELDAEGKINTLHEKYGEGSYKDYTFTYSDIK